MELIVWRRYCTGRVKQWAVVDATGKVLFKSDHKASCETVLRLLKGGKS